MSRVDKKFKKKEELKMKKIYKSKILQGKITITSVSKEWLVVTKNSYKKSTYQTYSYIINRYIITSDISDCSLSRLKTIQLVQFSDELISKGLSSKTINDIILILNSILKFASSNYKIEIPLAPRIKEKKKEMRVLSVLEQHKLENYLKGNLNNYNFGVLLALYTGIRIGELCALQWEDIKGGYIIIRKTMNRLNDASGKSVVSIGSPKTPNSNRIVPIPNFLIAVVESRRKSAKEYILSTASLKYVEPRLMQIKFKKITQKCKLENVTFHNLRHTFATRCVECGCDIKTLSEILGHSNVNTTLNQYVHSSMELKKMNIDKLGQFSV